MPIEGKCAEVVLAIRDSERGEHRWRNEIVPLKVEQRSGKRGHSAPRVEVRLRQVLGHGRAMRSVPGKFYRRCEKEWLSAPDSFGDGREIDEVRRCGIGGGIHIPLMAERTPESEPRLGI